MHYLAIFLLNSIVTEMPYLPKMNLFLWTTFLSKGFKNGIIQRFWRFLNSDCMAWTQHFTFAGFRKKGNSLGTLIVIFDNVSPKGFFFWLNMKNFEISVLTANPYYLQTVARKDMKLDRGYREWGIPDSGFRGLIKRLWYWTRKNVFNFEYYFQVSLTRYEVPRGGCNDLIDCAYPRFIDLFILLSRCL